MIFFVLECNNYKILNDYTRNVAYSPQKHEEESKSFACDNDGSSRKDDWKGDGWYRFMAPAGTKLPETSTAAPWGYCRTWGTGYLDGKHPTIPGELVNTHVCFNFNDSGYSLYCNHQRTAKVRHCGKYFVYFLKNLDCNYIKYRHCAE